MRRYLPLNLDVALLVLRLTLAAVLLYHGLPKVMNFGATVGMFQSMNIPAPALSAGFALLAEVVGGILILLGVAVDIAGLLVVIDMIGAIVFVHGQNGFDFLKNGWEHPFTVLAVALAIALAGPGGMAIGGKRATAYVGPERRRAA
jgi:putative oxidoreductase